VVHFSIFFCAQAWFTIEPLSAKPGSPWQNGHAESFVSTLRRGLDVEVFHNMAGAQIKLAIFRRFYNEQGPHSSIGNRPPGKAMLDCIKE